MCRGPKTIERANTVYIANIYNTVYNTHMHTNVYTCVEVQRLLKELIPLIPTEIHENDPNVFPANSRAGDFYPGTLYIYRDTHIDVRIHI